MRLGLAVLALMTTFALPACSRLGLAPSSLPPAGREPLEGFGAQTTGGSGGRVITISEPTEDAVRAAFADAATTGNAIITFAVTRPIAIVKKLPILVKPNLTIEGGGATLDGAAMKEGSAIVDIRTNDVIVRESAPPERRRQPARRRARGLSRAPSPTSRRPAPTTTASRSATAPTT